MSVRRLTRQLARLYELGLRLAEDMDADGVLLVTPNPTDWAARARRRGSVRVIVATDRAEDLAAAQAAGLLTVALDTEEAPVLERLTQALLQSVADEHLSTGGSVVALYSGFEFGRIDSMSIVSLDERLGRLTARDLRQLETRVPLDVLKIVVDLAVEIGREGREGKPVGTMFVVGDSRKVAKMAQPAGFDPVRGYNRKERDLRDRRVREAIKEIALLDGAFIVSSDGIVERACQIVDASMANITMTKGLGSRHWAGAAISRATSAVAIVVSESTGTVRLFQNGEVVLRVEPFTRAVTWQEFQYEPPAVEGGPS